jgi:malonate transporter
VLENVVRVIVICLPVFACIFLGRYLMAVGTMSPQAHGFINALVFRFSLPALIFRGVATQRFGDLLDLGVIVPTIGASAAVGLLTWLLTLVLPLRRDLASPVIFGTYWANLSYLGFPLAEAAYGKAGLDKAAVINAFTMPAMVISGVMLMSMGTGHAVAWGQQLRRAFLNPVVVAAFCGILVALVNELSGAQAWLLARPVVDPVVATATGTAAPATQIDWLLARQLGVGLLQVIDKLLGLIGAMGLPLALIAVGGSLQARRGEGHEYRKLLWLVSCGKLLACPAICWALLLFFPETSEAGRGAAILLMATPAAVAAYVIATEMGDEPGFVAGHLVLSTLLGCVTIPLWLYLLLSS